MKCDWFKVNTALCKNYGESKDDILTALRDAFHTNDLVNEDNYLQEDDSVYRH
jgi:hypothetical protein